MKIHGDFQAPVHIRTGDQPWVPSPMPGVSRIMLDRVGGEVAWATSLVRYAPGSQFSAHTHGGGEEFLVLEGVFQDENGDYPAGTYVRNAPGTRHTPGSLNGCTILVKLWQFYPGDSESCVVRTQFNAHLLCDNGFERVELLVLEPGQSIQRPAVEGFECWVLSGSSEAWAPGDWVRVCAAKPMAIKAGDQGLVCWIKTGHLRDVPARLARLPV